MSPDVFVGHHEKAFDDRLPNLLDDAHVREVCRVVDLNMFSVGLDVTS